MLINKKSQTLTYDFFIAITIFFAILTIMFGYWFYSVVQMQEVKEKNFAISTLIQASQVWFKEGYPKHWGLENVLELGLTNENMINRTKMEMLPQIGYQKLISLLNTGKYNLQYTLYNETNIIFQFPERIDLNSSKNIYKIERIGILDNKIVKIRTIIWD
ncbi:MAG: hypothetical protein QXX38_01820 [Candidatus Aenigmatarchaeota archaeon]